MPHQMSSSDLYERGFVLMELRMFHPAIDDFQTAAGDARYAGKAYVPMALCLRALGRHEEAIAAFRQAITSPMVSPVEQRHILYQLGRTLEFLGRCAESLEVYGRISKGDQEFRDVAQRIKYLSSGKRGPYSRIRDWWGGGGERGAHSPSSTASAYTDCPGADRAMVRLACGNVHRL